MDQVWVLLLRGVNVGGRHRLAMADFRILLDSLGFQGVATHIQSGNAVFRAPADPDLAQRIGAAITRQSLVDRVLDPDREGTSRTLDVHFSRVRKKLGAEGARIATVWGVGYRLLPS